MKIVTIMGSPRLKGNTNKVLEMFEQEMAAQNHTIDRINVTKYKINGCIGCYKCTGDSENPGCVQKDDCMALFERIMAADAIVYASPLYWFSFSAQIKPLIDRHVCFIKGLDTPEYKSLIADKPAALLVTCDDKIENNAEAIQTIFSRISEYCATKVAGKYIVANCATEGELDRQAPDVAKAMAADMANFLK